MVYSLEWNPEYFEPVVILSTALFSIIGFWLTTHSSVLERIFNNKYSEGKAKIAWIFFWRFMGIFFYLVVPLFILFFILKQDIGDFGIRLIRPWESLTWIIGLGIAIILIQSIAANNKSNLKQYPQIRISEWSKTLFCKNVIFWFIYLFSYEFMFRGFLLFGTLFIFGVWPSIIINTVLYSLSHMPKGFRETVLAIPFGVFICYLTLRVETIWVAVFLHFSLAVSNDFFSIRANPEMKFK